MNDYQTHRRQLYMLPTVIGYWLLLAIIAIFLVAVKYDNQPAFLMSFLLASIGMVSMHYTHGNMVNIRLRVTNASPVFSGETAVFHTSVENDANKARHALWLFVDNKKHNFMLPPSSKQTLDIQAVALQRGYQQAPAVKLYTKFPFGLLFCWSKTINMEATCLVYPKPTEPLPFPGTANSGAEQTSASRIAIDSELAGLRPYEIGDELKHIHWRATARLQKPVTKVMSTQGSEELHFDWAQTHGKDTEMRLSILSRWIIDAEQQQHRYALTTPHKTIAASNGNAHYHECLKTLALWPS